MPPGAVQDPFTADFIVEVDPKYMPCTFRFLLIVPERLWGNEFTKIILNGSPRGRFKHPGVLPGAKLHARHDGNSEILS